jgi:spore maturation protein A
MNMLFGVIFAISSVILLFSSPETFLSTLIDGSSFAASVCISLIATYAVWLGVMQLWKDSGLSRKISKLLRPATKKLFLTDDDETLDNVCMNLSVNLLGISGAATAYGVRAAQLLDKSSESEYASAMLFILNATSIQLIPTSIIVMRVSLGSIAPADILLPTLLATTFSTLLGALLCRILIPPKRKKAVCSIRENRAFFKKTKGAGI